MERQRGHTPRRWLSDKFIEDKSPYRDKSVAKMSPLFNFNILTNNL